jgi:predicted AlkP superfamily phosphohydrolase/phosphomutase
LSWRKRYKLIFVLGIDAATWAVVKPNLAVLPSFKRLIELGEAKELILKEKPVSPSIWCGMFSGKTFEEHKHDNFVVNGKLVKREDIKVDFIWDILEQKGETVKAFNVPFVVPPYSFRVDFKPVGFGLPTNEKEWQEELEKVSLKVKELLTEKPDVLIAVYTLLDRVQHFHWGEDCVLEWYQKLDNKMGALLFDSGFLEEKQNKLIIISDHGFCSFGEAKVQTLPLKSEWGELKGDHCENALLITVNIDYRIAKPQDVFYTLTKEFEGGVQ